MKRIGKVLTLLTVMLLIGNLFFNQVEAKAAQTSVSAPISVKAASSSYNSIYTSWGVVTGASGYEIFRATSSTGAYTLVSKTTTTNYNNTGLATNSTYYYKVRAYTMSGTTKVYSNFSAIVSAKPIPAVPSSVKVAASSYNSIKATWAAVTGASGYEVYRTTSSTGTYNFLSTTTTTSYNNTGLITNSTYYYKVRAYRLVGTIKVYSSFSAIVNAKPIPATPTSPKAVSTSSSSIYTSWGAVAGANGYEIHRATSSTGTYTLISTTNSTFYNNTGLKMNATYYYKVRAYRMVGTVKVYSLFTNVVSAAPTPLNPTYYVESRPDNDFTNVVVLYITNKGNKPMRISNQGSFICYHDPSKTQYERDLQLINMNADIISYTEIPAGGGGYVCFGVIGNRTYYDEDAYVYYEFTYDSVAYYGRTSYNNGSQYLKK